MKVDFGKQTFLFPMPVLIIGTYNEDGSANAMNAAWGGIYNDKQICICLDKSHKTVANVKEKKAFTVSVADAENITACDYVGIESGNDVKNKIEKAGFNVSKSRFVDAPVFDNLKMVLECEMVSYDDKTEQLIGNIINVSAEESVLTDGKIDPSKLKPVTYDPVNHNYVQLGEVVAKAFDIGVKLK
ncbi:MAG: flavin reductase family protein [Treponema sp.]|uniref:flavin reductase family protein n=1 Tax=Treponema sp. TaxID=166 RepID=UPI00298DD0E7|nr:flavin reductase family protein [Treponema sp.]MBR5933794.1 flavin reductase family protein [Treponema sp.]